MQQIILHYILAAGLVCSPQITVTRATFFEELFIYIPKKFIYTLFLPKLHELRGKFNYDGKAAIFLDLLKAHYNIAEQIIAEKENMIFLILEMCVIQFIFSENAYFIIIKFAFLE